MLHRRRRAPKAVAPLVQVSAAALLTTAMIVVGCGAAQRTRTRTGTPASSTAVTATASTSAATATTTSAKRSPTAPPVPSVIRPPIVWDPIPFGSRRRAEMVAYVRRHYGSFMKPTWRLIHPHVIVIHYTDASYGSTFNTFATDVSDSELHELPATCTHFVIDTNGTIRQLVSLKRMCRHTVGLNWTAIGIEHVGYSDQQVLENRRQVTASLRLVRWLRCRYHIPIEDVIGHHESLTSPYHREDVPALRTQTHGDFSHASMKLYRRRLRALGRCA